MLEKIINNKCQLLESIIIFVITLLFNLICTHLSGDEIWNYGFSYNIANGMIPYKDFNMIITPLYPIIGGIFMIILGKNLVIYHILNSVICTIIYYYMKKFTPQAYYLVYTIFLFYALPSYNIFCILLLYILMNMEETKENDYLIGIILGITLITKQNIGVYLCIPTILIKDHKRILKRVIGFLIPNLILLIYLLINNCLLEFIDYTILGISTFAKQNILTNPSCLIIIIISITYLLYQYIRTKKINVIYLLCFQLLVFPLIDSYHLMIAIIPVIGYFLNTIKLNKKLILTACISFIITIFITNIYDIYTGYSTFPNLTNEYKYRKIKQEEDIAIKKISDYINTIEDDLYLITINAYMLKLESNIQINKYDLLHNGNLGKGGEKKIINEIENNCSQKKCVFLIDLQELSKNKELSYANDITKYIIINYNPEKRIEAFYIYKNY